MMKNILLLLLLPLALFGQQQVFYNAKIFTANPSKPYASAVAVEGKMITAVGNYAEVKKKAGVNADWVDMKGGFLMPGIVDSHNHGIHGGQGLTKANTKDELLTVEQLYSYVKEMLSKKEGMTGDVLVVYGLNIGTWKWLDRIGKYFNGEEFATQPLVLRGSDGHTGWCNMTMMKRAGLTKAFVSSLKAEDKVFYGVDNNGEPTGFVSESGTDKIEGALPAETDFSKAAQKAIEYNNRNGITAWLDPCVSSFNNTYTNLLDWYQYLISKNKLNAHIAATVVADINTDPQKQIDALKVIQKKYNATNFSVLGFKVFADGVVEHPTHTAALSIPYTGTQSKGVLMFEPEKFARLATMADKENLLMHVHAIGDRAVTETLNGFEIMRKINGGFLLPHAITHLQIVQPSDVDRFAQLNIFASVQLLWAFGDETTIDIVRPYIDPSLFKWQYPARSLLQAGATICGASDWPVTSANPFEAIYRAETRKGPLGVLDSTQCMPRLPMLYAYTREAAKALMLENKIGSIEEGKFADIILLDRDILTLDAEEVKKTKVLWTMFEGKKVFEAK